MLDIQPFLTAYDPTDLPGGSVDPLGFDTGYELFAEKILPGLTNVANRPRYLSAFCAALVLIEACDVDGPGVGVREAKREIVQRMERFWALACVLASEKDASLPASGVRGLRYVQGHIRRISARTSSNADYRLLSHQARYGMLAIYGPLADKLRLASTDTYDLTDPGRRLGEAFLRETDMPEEIRAAVIKPAAVNLELIAEWGLRAHVNGKPGADEAAALVDTIEGDATRSRMCAHLRAHPPCADESELHRLGRILQALDASPDRDLAEAVRAILAYEKAFRSSLLAFQRVLARTQAAPYMFKLADVDGDPVFARLHREAGGVFDALDRALSETKTTAFQQGLDRAGEVRRFVAATADAKTPEELVVTVLERHRAVLGARMSGGRPKMPWLEIDGGVVRATLASAQQMRGEPDTPEAIAAHPYRSWAADRFYGPWTAVSGGEA